MTSVYIVLFHGSPVAAMTSAADGANVAKSLGAGSTVVSCLLNGYTATGKVLLDKPGSGLNSATSNDGKLH